MKVASSPGTLIRFDRVSKSYPIYEQPAQRLVELLTLNRLRRHREFTALRDISFEIRAGETFCVIGENGSGKSTLLQLIAGILYPTSGDISVQGRVAALLELGSGFNPEFTGRENVYLNAAILGLSAKEVDQLYQPIIDFAEIGDFIHQPVKTYSSGMAVRLAFAVAIHVHPEILLVDEALAVGDIYFRQRCLRKVHELRAQGVTILFVSHSMGDVKAIGDRTLWLEQGHVKMLDRTDRVVSHYLAAMAAKDQLFQQEHPALPETQASAEEYLDHLPNVDHRFGDGRAIVTGIGLFNTAGQPIHLLTPCSRAILRVSVQARATVPHPNVGFMLRNHLGLDFAGTNTLRESIPLPPLAPGQRLTVDFHLDLPHLYPGSFSFSPAIADGPLEAYSMCDWVENALILQMEHGAGPVYGYLHLPCRVEVNARLIAQPTLEDELITRA